MTGEMSLYENGNRFLCDYDTILRIWDRSLKNGIPFKYLFLILDCCYANSWGDSLIVNIFKIISKKYSSNGIGGG